MQRGVTGKKAGMLILPTDHLLKADIFGWSCQMYSVLFLGAGGH